MFGVPEFTRAQAQRAQRQLKSIDENNVTECALSPSTSEETADSESSLSAHSSPKKPGSAGAYDPPSLKSPTDNVFESDSSSELLDLNHLSAPDKPPSIPQALNTESQPTVQDYPDDLNSPRMSSPSSSDPLGGLWTLHGEMRPPRIMLKSIEILHQNQEPLNACESSSEEIVRLIECSPMYSASSDQDATSPGGGNSTGPTTGSRLDFSNPDSFNIERRETPIYKGTSLVDPFDNIRPLEESDSDEEIIKIYSPPPSTSPPEKSKTIDRRDGLEERTHRTYSCCVIT